VTLPPLRHRKTSPK